MGVRGDLLIDCESKRESCATGFGWDAGLRARADSVEEVFELKAEGFAFGDVGFGK